MIVSKQTRKTYNIPISEEDELRLLIREFANSTPSHRGPISRQELEEHQLRVAIREVLKEEQQQLLEEGILDFFKGIFKAFLALFGVELGEQTQQAYTEYVQRADTVAKEKAGKSWADLKPDEEKLDYGIVTERGRKEADDAVKRALPAMEKFREEKVPAIPPKGDKEFNEKYKTQLSTLLAGLGPMVAAIQLIGAHSAEFKKKAEELEKGGAAPMDLVQKMGGAAQILGPLASDPSQADKIKALAVEYITQGGGAANSIDNLGTAASAGVEGPAGEAAASAGETDEGDIKDQAEDAGKSIEKGAEEAQEGLAANIKEALTSWAAKVGFTDPCKYVEENKAAMEEEMGVVEKAISILKGDAPLPERLKGFGATLVGLSASSMGVALFTALKGTQSFSAIANVVSFGSIGTPATTLGMQAMTWVAVGKYLLLAAAVVLVYRWLLKKGYACTIKEWAGKAWDAVKAGLPVLIKGVKFLKDAVVNFGKKVWGWMSGPDWEKKEAELTAEGIRHRRILHAGLRPYQRELLLRERKKAINEWDRLNQAAYSCTVDILRLCEAAT